jgi:microsomal epoxide hydrolase
MPPRPYSIRVPQDLLEDLAARLARTRWPTAIPGSNWDYGADVLAIKDLCDYWRNGFDWRLHERQLNRYPQFTSTVDGVDIHYWHVKGKGPNPFPLLLIHGWPGSIVEFFAMIEPLTDPDALGGNPAESFDVVIPALPGFGFSGKPTQRGWGITRMAAAFDRLMSEELGYERYGVQGGDWGGIISSKMASAHGDHVAAAHLNFALGTPPQTMTEADEEWLAQRSAFQAVETGYSAIQGTKPMSLAVAQSDSPAGLAAWIVEKFRAWSDCAGEVENAFSRDVLLMNLMFYWAPNSIASAARIYFEAQRDPGAFRYPRVETPTAFAVFPKEPWRAPRSWLEPRYNIRRWTEMPRGGHFAALEQPELLLRDVREFFREFRS